MLTNPQAMTFQKINIAVYHQHKSDKIDHEILQYHLRGKCTKNTARGPTRNPEVRIGLLRDYNSNFKNTVLIHKEKPKEING